MRLFPIASLHTSLNFVFAKNGRKIHLKLAGLVLLIYKILKSFCYTKYFEINHLFFFLYIYNTEFFRRYITFLKIKNKSALSLLFARYLLNCIILYIA